MSKAQLIPADLRAPVYRVVAANGGVDTFDQMVALYKEAELHEEKDRIARREKRKEKERAKTYSGVHMKFS